MNTTDYGEVIDIQKTFHNELKRRRVKIVYWVIFSIVWISVGLYFWAGILLNSSLGFILLVAPILGLGAWLSSLYEKIRKDFWFDLASAYKWKFDVGRNFVAEKALIFQVGHSQRVLNGILGEYSGHTFRIFEYQYSVGHGKGKQDFVLTLFEVVFTGTFPHMYIDHKGNSHSSPLGIGSSSVAKIPLPKEFADSFNFYSPKEYEIETLEIFTPDIFAQLLNEGWNHDMEFVDGKLFIYRKVRFNSFVELEKELNKVKRFVDVLGPRLNRLKLSQIGDISPTL